MRVQYLLHSANVHIPDEDPSVAQKVFLRYAYLLLETLQNKGFVNVIIPILTDNDTREVKGSIVSADLKSDIASKGHYTLSVGVFYPEIVVPPNLELVLMTKGELYEDKELIISLSPHERLPDQP